MSKAKRKYRGRLLDDGDMARTRADGAGRNPDRGREALSPQGILYARTWSEMARETRPSARFEPAVSARFGCHRHLPVWLCLPPYIVSKSPAGIRRARWRRAALLRWSGHDRKLAVRPTLNDRLTGCLIPPCQLSDEVTRIFLRNPRRDSIDLCSALAAQFNQRQADSRRDKIHGAQCVLHRSRIANRAARPGEPGIQGGARAT